MTEAQNDTGSRSHALLISSDPDFVERAMDMLHARMRVAHVTASDDHLEAVVKSADPDLFIVDVDNIDWQVSGRMATIEQIRSLFPDVPIAFTSYDISTATLIPAMRAGANDVFDKNASGDEILAVTDQLTHRRSTRAPTGDGKIIVTMGLRAGVGATTLCLALAQAILESDRSLGPVLYLDFSAAPCEAADLLDIEPNYSMGDAVNDLSRLDVSMIESAFARTENGLYVLPLALESDVQNSFDVRDIPKLIFVLKSFFRLIFVDANRHVFSSPVFDHLFDDSDASILCTDQSITSVHACSAFLRQYVGPQPEISLAITRYDPRIAPGAESIAQTIGGNLKYHVIPWDRHHVDNRRNAGLPLIHPGAHSPFAESARNFMAEIDEEFSAALINSRKKHYRWRKLLHLVR